MTDDCTHDELELETSIDHHQADDLQWTSMRVRVRCATCHEMYSWRGLNSGHPNPDEPVTSGDGYELRAPIVPGPGAVVGLLKTAGLEHELMDPRDS